MQAYGSLSICCTSTLLTHGLIQEPQAARTARYSFLLSIPPTYAAPGFTFQPLVPTTGPPRPDPELQIAD